MSIILAWLAPHALSLIMPVIVMVAAEANEHNPPSKPARTKPLQVLLMSRSIFCPKANLLVRLLLRCARDQSYDATRIDLTERVSASSRTDAGYQIFMECNLDYIPDEVRGIDCEYRLPFTPKLGYNPSNNGDSRHPVRSMRSD